MILNGYSFLNKYSTKIISHFKSMPWKFKAITIFAAAVLFLIWPIKFFIYKIKHIIVYKNYNADTYTSETLNVAESARELLEKAKTSEEFPVPKLVRCIMSRCNFDNANKNDLQECLNAIFRLSISTNAKECDDQQNLPDTFFGTSLNSIITFIKKAQLYKEALSSKGITNIASLLDDKDTPINNWILRATQIDKIHEHAAAFKTARLSLK